MIDSIEKNMLLSRMSHRCFSPSRWCCMLAHNCNEMSNQPSLSFVIDNKMNIHYHTRNHDTQLVELEKSIFFFLRTIFVSFQESDDESRISHRVGWSDLGDWKFDCSRSKTFSLFSFSYVCQASIEQSHIEATEREREIFFLFWSSILVNNKFACLI